MSKERLREALMPWKKSEPMEQREEFVLRALRTENLRALCQEYGISAKTGDKWQERFLRLGLGGMEEESGRPQSHAAQLGEAEVCAIIRLKNGASSLGSTPDSGAVLASAWSSSQ